MNNTTCSKCNQAFKATEHTPGYGVKADGSKVCFECCGLEDLAELKALTGNAKKVLYLANNEVTNWPGTLKIKPSNIRTSNHNMAGRNGRTDVWFRVGGKQFHGVNIGDNQILRVKAVKA